MRRDRAGPLWTACWRSDISRPYAAHARSHARHTHPRRLPIATSKLLADRFRLCPSRLLFSQAHLHFRRDSQRARSFEATHASELSTNSSVLRDIGHRCREQLDRRERCLSINIVNLTQRSILAYFGTSRLINPYLLLGRLEKWQPSQLERQAQCLPALELLPVHQGQ